uniref:Variant surface glycoprotein 1509 n=1 Tax=Trypanosoma brucei TaxID=5691 RepID=M4SYM5_9TRYP|nr:variant surface glycoprotein 1509 [Trypanosoma brucei]
MTALRTLFFLVGALSVVYPTTATQEALTAAGMRDACKLATTLKKIGVYSKTMTAKLTEATSRLQAKKQLFALMLSEANEEPTETQLNIYFYISSQLRAAERELKTKLPQAIAKGLKAAEAAGRIDETVHLLANANTGSSNDAYCVAKATATGEPATVTEMPECYDGGIARSVNGPNDVDTEPRLETAQKAVAQNQDRAKNPKTSANCLLTSTANTNGFLGNAGGTHGEIKLMGGVLKVTGAAWTAANWIDTTTAPGPGYPLTELLSMLGEETATLKTSLDKISKLSKLGDEDKVNLDQVEASTEELGLRQGGMPIIIKGTDFDTVSKQLKAFKESKSDNLDDFQKTFDSQILKKALTPTTNTEECANKSIGNKDICRKITG